MESKWSLWSFWQLNNRFIKILWLSITWILLAKLEVLDFSNGPPRLVFNYVPNRKQRVKISHSFSSLSKILFGVPQSLILRPLLFNFFYMRSILCPWRLWNCKLCRWLSTPLSVEKNHNLVVEKLEKSILFKLPKNNYMKNNGAKFILYYLRKHKKHQTLMTIILNRNIIELDMIRRTY